MILRRKEAITLSSFFKFFNLSIEERKTKIEDALAELSLEVDDVAPEVSNYYARKYIEYDFSCFTNAYLQLFLSDQLGRTIEVKGVNRKLLSCLCCGYKTLKGGGWEICDVCYWEDVGNVDPNEYISVNKMTLCEAKKNFKKFAVISKKIKKNVDPDRMLQYERSV
ncbi:MAG TPA: CPCC family cysteine-rich protein [Mucilaginibacter sp.]|jgi:hypothetical protein|nr:CPCC family cysteine-rich protein [Mucilaginibacter sp.]